MKKTILILILLVFASACTMTEQQMQEKAMEERQVIEEMTKDMPAVSDWVDIELTDVSTGETFRISDFKGKPVLLESFSVWCPTCKKQQDKIKELHEEVGDSVVSISLDTDPNEDEAKVRGHATRYDFDWYFAVSPVELTKALIDDFGIGVVNAPSAPIVLICADQSARMLPRGVKDADELKTEIGRGC
ncbi:redoxin family protein [Candidatus Woesearchaeota archaeon]|nr:redoxin family protein [Candidatus Woesearchaeota archaeon]